MNGYFKKQILTSEANNIFDISIDDIFNMIQINEADRFECEKITQSVYNNENPIQPNDSGSTLRHKIYDELLYRYPKTAGFVMKYPHGVIITQAERNHFYRGEKQIYDKSIPTLLRKLNKKDTNEDKELFKIINEMRIAEFGIFLVKFDFIQQWPYKIGSTVLFDVIAQHYGLNTNWLDITNDFLVALFFANCFWDNNTDSWKPLTRNQTEKNENTKYGLIYHCPSWQKELHNGYELTNEKGERVLDNAILPIGFQPFMRCHMQSAYGIKMLEEFPLQNDVIFEKLRFRHNEELSTWIFERMGKGKLIYPHEGLSQFNDIIQKIKGSHVFSEEAFNFAFSKNKYFTNKEQCLNKILSTNILGHSIEIGRDKHPYSLSSQRIKDFDKVYKDFSIEKEYNIKLGTCKVF